MRVAWLYSFLWMIGWFWVNADITRDLLERASIKAIRSLLKLMQDEEVSERVRCNAARSILELHFKGCELADIEESIAELRNVLQELPATQKGLRAV